MRRVLSAVVQRAVDTSDGDLARAITAGASGTAGEAEAELYRRFAPRVRLYGLRHLRNEDAALDLAQQVLLMTIEKLRQGAVRASDEIASFILGTSRTVVIDLRRRERRRADLLDAFLPRQNFAPPEADTHLDLDQLEGCLAQLSDRERTVVFLTFYGERNAAAVANEIGATEGHVRVIRHRAVARLRTCVTSLRGPS
jgi:RNA polymerase sigma-70 factor (ECF subfamily)